MFSLSPKIMKPHGKRLGKFKSGIYQALHELERNWDPRAHLRELNATAAKEIEVGSGWKVLITFKIQIQLACELEKKFSGKLVVFIAQRTLPYRHFILFINNLKKNENLGCKDRNEL
uniref:40S ribosomal protein S7 n=1 Tax=Canis lupus familiaris TaxID=9615 RepID=A0A8C0NH58_CANLF